MGRRVVITGMGAVSPLGLDVASLWQGITEARSAIGPITLCPTEGLDTRFAGEVRGFDPHNYMDRKEARRTDRFVHFAIAASAEAIRAAELLVTDANAERIGVLIGSGIGGLATLADGVNTLTARGPGRIGPFLVPAMITNMAAGQVSMAHNLQGPNFCVTSACATAAHAIGEAAEIIRRGWADAMVAGGSEAPITPIGIAAFASARAVSTRNDEPATASRPFDATRDGFVLAEGGAVVVLESLEHALARGARILAEVAGYGLSADAYHVTQPLPGGEGALRAMRMALANAGLSAADIDYINAHGTSTPVGDAAETHAIKALLGERAHTVPVSSNKSQVGHLLGAAGSLEAIVTVLAMQHDLLPATINYATPDPQCDLDYVPNTPRPAHITTAISNSFGFGGHNVTLVLRRYAA
ncbi:MAG TPA: beta-ketoacyl-ACP synthase II [Roseiflexaceae bacterium]|nr:beta-ketoacyl-ACP synthase II [Roseiflexaceae bacterium]HMP43008.1 beta-ketoacyl-ACP synthase II [Roseiflexaceae bacterium]